MISVSFYSPVKRLVAIQKLVKRYNGRFRATPLIVSGDRVNMTIDFEDGLMYNKFSTMNTIIGQNYY